MTTKVKMSYCTCNNVKPASTKLLSHLLLSQYTIHTVRQWGGEKKSDGKHLGWKKESRDEEKPRAQAAEQLPVTKQANDGTTAVPVEPSASLCGIIMWQIRLREEVKQKADKEGQHLRHCSTGAGATMQRVSSCLEMLACRRVRFKHCTCVLDPSLNGNILKCHHISLIQSMEHKPMTLTFGLQSLKATSQ